MPGECLWPRENGPQEIGSSGGRGGKRDWSWGVEGGGFLVKCEPL